MQPTVPEGQNQNLAQATEATPVNSVAETTPQSTYAPEALTSNLASGVPAVEAIPQAQAPVQNSSEGYYQISTPPTDIQPQPVVATESVPAPQNPTQNSSEGNYQTQLDPGIAQAQADMAIPTEPIKINPQEFSSASASAIPSPTFESTSPVPSPEPVVAGADTSSSEFPGSPQTNLPQEAPSENSSQKFVNIEVLKKEYDPMVIEAIHKIMGLAEIQLAEAGGDPRKEQSVIGATTNSLTDINRVVTGIKPLEETSNKI